MCWTFIIQVRSKCVNQLPFIVTHEWPGSVIELLKIVDLLTNSAARGGSAVNGFRVVIPSFPGHGFSDKATTTITDQW